MTSPDQAFVDELGRVTVVEVKKVRAPLGIISQMTAYANHWQSLPFGEIDRNLRGFADAVERLEIFGKALFELQVWAGDVARRTRDPEHLQRLGRAVLSRLNPKWARSPAASVSAIVRQWWGDQQLPCVGAAPRMIGVAPSFRDECVEFAEQLSQRMVPIELVEIEIVKSSGDILVGRQWAHRDPESEATWRLLRSALAQPQIRENFHVNGWADALSAYSFSLSARKVSDARFWIWASPDKACVWTVVPDGWYKTDVKRRHRVRESFLDALPVPVNRSQRWLEWEFDCEKHEALTRCIGDVAAAVCKVLVLSAPPDRLQ